MGTRHLIGVWADGDFRLAQYGQWDGYPSGQGVDILAFLRKGNLSDFREKCLALRWATEEDSKRVEESGENWTTEFPSMTRDTSADLLPLIADGAVEFVHDSRDFALDSLFCEWAYVINLDLEVLEVYRGFQKEPPKHGRWVGMEGTDRERNGYYPVELVGAYKFTDLPDNDTFCREMDPPEEEE